MLQAYYYVVKPLEKSSNQEVVCPCSLDSNSVSQSKKVVGGNFASEKEKQLQAPTRRENVPLIQILRLTFDILNL